MKHFQNNLKIMTLEEVQKEFREVKDFPKKGIVFIDFTTALKQPECIKTMSDALYDHYKNMGITKVVGIESRGFFMATAICTRLNAGFVPLRKPGKLPAETLSETYNKEYGTDTIEIHKDALTEDDIVLIHDDILATGGTIQAAIKLIRKFNVKRIYLNFIGEIDFLKGIDKIDKEIEVYSLFHV